MLGGVRSSEGLGDIVTYSKSWFLSSTSPYAVSRSEQNQLVYSKHTTGWCKPQLQTVGNQSCTHLAVSTEDQAQWTRLSRGERCIRRGCWGSAEARLSPGASLDPVGDNYVHQRIVVHQGKIPTRVCLCQLEIFRVFWVSTGESTATMVPKRSKTLVKADNVRSWEAMGSSTDCSLGCHEISGIS